MVTVWLEKQKFEKLAKIDNPDLPNYNIAKIKL